MEHMVLTEKRAEEAAVRERMSAAGAVNGRNLEKLLKDNKDTEFGRKI